MNYLFAYLFLYLLGPWGKEKPYISSKFNPLNTANL